MYVSALKKSIIAFSFIGLLSCDKAGEVAPNTDPQIALKTQFEKILPVIQQQVEGQKAIQQMVTMIQEMKGIHFPNGRISAEMALQGEIPTCAQMTTDLKNKTMVIDFGTGSCKTPSGQPISGKFTMSITNQIIKVQMDNLRLEGVSLNGMLELSGIYSKSANPEVTATATNLQVVLNAKNSTFTITMRMKWNVGFSTFDKKSDDDILVGNYSKEVDLDEWKYKGL